METTAPQAAILPHYTLASINKTADKINLQRLEEIEAEEFVYEGTVDGTFEEKRFPVELKLRLKVGLEIIFLLFASFVTYLQMSFGRPSCI